MQLVKPKVSLKNQYLNMISEWKEYGGELIPWSLNFDNEDFDLLVKNLNGWAYIPRVAWL